MVTIASAAASRPRSIRLSWPERAGALELTLISSLSVALLLLVWEVAARTGLIPIRFISAPSNIAGVGVRLLLDGTLLRHLQVSAQELALGFALAVVVGVTLGALLASYDWLDALLDPYLSFFYAVPRVALVPLLVLWFGIGLNAKVALVFLSAVFPIVLTVTSGFRLPNPDLVRAARSFGASNFQVFRDVTLPGSVPFLITAMQLGMGRALIGVVVAEMYAASAGIGFFISNSGALLQTDRLFVGIVVLAIVGLLLMGAIDLIEARVRRWFPEERR